MKYMQYVQSSLNSLMVMSSRIQFTLCFSYTFLIWSFPLLPQIENCPNYYQRVCNTLLFFLITLILLVHITTIYGSLLHFYIMHIDLYPWLELPLYNFGRILRTGNVIFFFIFLRTEILRKSLKVIHNLLINFCEATIPW